MIAPEEPVVFDFDGERLVGILTGREARNSTGALIVVGGPQYRVGSHRQFVLLARALANAGFPTFRFDYRGMGDSGGAQRTFESIEPDLLSAIAAFRAKVPTMHRLVIFGLCDGASAALMSACDVEGLAGLILANPWVRRPESQNATLVRHYYKDRLASREFWSKLLSGRVLVMRSAAEAMRRLLAIGRMRFGHRGDVPRTDFVTAMLSNWRNFSGDRLVILSERDLTAREFEDMYRRDPEWARIPITARTRICRIKDADHTFSSTEHRIVVERACVEFLESLADTHPAAPAHGIPTGRARLAPDH